MESNFITLELHNDRGDVLVKPGEITSISPAPEGGSRVVTRQKQIYYVTEPMCNVEAIITLYFKTLRGEL